MPPSGNRYGLTCSTEGQRVSTARACSRSMGLRFNSSGVQWLMALPRSTMMVFGPKLRNRLLMAVSSPAMMEPTPITAPVPMITPSTVRNERSLCSRTVPSAKRIPETSAQSLTVAPSFFRPEGLDGIELGGAFGRIDAEKQPHGGGKRHADHHRHQPRRGHADQPAGRGQDRRFDQELVEDISPPCTH